MVSPPLVPHPPDPASQLSPLNSQLSHPSYLCSSVFICGSQSSPCLIARLFVDPLKILSDAPPRPRRHGALPDARRLVPARFVNQRFIVRLSTARREPSAAAPRPRVAPVPALVAERL